MQPVTGFAKVPFSQPVRSDHDVLRVATLVKEMLNSENKRLVKERVERKTVDLRSTVIALQQENVQQR